MINPLKMVINRHHFLGTFSTAQGRTNRVSLPYPQFGTPKVPPTQRQSGFPLRRDVGPTAMAIAEVNHEVD